MKLENNVKFKSLFGNDSRFRIPRVFRDYSSQRVLTTEFCPGLDFRTFLSQASQEAKSQAAEAIWDFSYRSIFRHGIFNYDPHPGNYLFRDGRVTVLDFGGVKTFSQKFIGRWKDLNRAVMEEDRRKIKSLLIEMDFIPAKGSIDLDYYVNIINKIFEPWRRNRRFKFTENYVRGLWNQLVVFNPNRLVTNMPADWLCAHRLQWGVYSLMTFLDAESNWHQRMVELIY